MKWRDHLDVARLLGRRDPTPHHLWMSPSSASKSQTLLGKRKRHHEAIASFVLCALEASELGIFLQ